MNKRLERTTAEQANYLASVGVVVKSDLEEWADTQNPYCASIRWRVEEKHVPIDGEHYMNIPYLIAEEIE